MVSVVKVRVQLRDVWMRRQAVLYLQFFFHLLEEVIVVEQLLLDFLDGHDTLTALLLCLDHLPKLA